MAPIKAAGVYFVDTEGILIDHGDERIVLILKGRRLNQSIIEHDTHAGRSPDEIEAARAQCIDQIDVLDGKMRELEKTITNLRDAYLLLTERRWAAS
jgi:hypothetical protein